MDNGNLGINFVYVYAGDPSSASIQAFDCPKGSLVIDTTNGVVYTKILGLGTNTAGYATAVTNTGTQTLTNKTLTSPTINSPTISGATNSGNIASDTKVLAADFTAASGSTGSTLTSLTGVSWTVVAGATYRFRAALPAVTQTANGGAKMAFKLTTATLTSINLRVRPSTDTDNTGAVSTNFNTTTDQTAWFDQKTAVYTNYTAEGSFVVGTGGTLAVQAAQNTSHADTTTITAGAFFELVRTA